VHALRTRGLALRRLGVRDGALSCWRQALAELGDLQVRQRAEIESLLAEEPS
jgi:hypothetical protein